MLSRFARGIGAARGGDAAQARAELEALKRIERALVDRKETYWARVAGIKRQALHAWTLLSAGDEEVLHPLQRSRLERRRERRHSHGVRRRAARALGAARQTIPSTTWR
jgi:hypothetical protein